MRSRRQLIKISLIQTLALMVALSLSTKTQAQERKYHDHNQIKLVAEQYAKQQISLNPDEKLTLATGSIDSRLKLRQCQEDLETFIPSQLAGNHISMVGVRCPSPVRWQLYVPIKVKVTAPIIVAAKPINKNHRINASDLRLRYTNRQSIRGSYYLNKKDIIGKVSRKFISQNSVISPSLLGEQQMVKRGQQVIVLAELSGLSVKTKGIALGNGAKGDVIRVRNSRSERIIDAVVIAPGEVKVGL